MFNFFLNTGRAGTSFGKLPNGEDSRSQKVSSKGGVSPVPSDCGRTSVARGRSNGVNPFCHNRANETITPKKEVTLESSKQRGSFLKYFFPNWFCSWFSWSRGSRNSQGNHDDHSTNESMSAASKSENSDLACSERGVVEKTAEIHEAMVGGHTVEGDDHSTNTESMSENSDLGRDVVEKTAEIHEAMVGGHTVEGDDHSTNTESMSENSDLAGSEKVVFKSAAEIHEAMAQFFPNWKTKLGLENLAKGGVSRSIDDVLTLMNNSVMVLNSGDPLKLEKQNIESSLTSVRSRYPTTTFLKEMLPDELLKEGAAKLEALITQCQREIENLKEEIKPIEVSLQKAQEQAKENTRGGSDIKTLIVNLRKDLDQKSSIFPELNRKSRYLQEVKVILEDKGLPSEKKEENARSHFYDFLDTHKTEEDKKPNGGPLKKLFNAYDALATAQKDLTEHPERDFRDNPQKQALQDSLTSGLKYIRSIKGSRSNLFSVEQLKALETYLLNPGLDMQLQESAAALVPPEVAKVNTNILHFIETFTKNGDVFTNNRGISWGYIFRQFDYLEVQIQKIQKNHSDYNIPFRETINQMKQYLEDVSSRPTLEKGQSMKDSLALLSRDEINRLNQMTMKYHAGGMNDPIQKSTGTTLDPLVALEPTLPVGEQTAPIMESTPTINVEEALGRVPNDKKYTKLRVVWDELKSSLKDKNSIMCSKEMVSGKLITLKNILQNVDTIISEPAPVSDNNSPSAPRTRNAMTALAGQAKKVSQSVGITESDQEKEKRRVAEQKKALDGQLQKALDYLKEIRDSNNGRLVALTTEHITDLEAILSIPKDS